MALSGLLRDFFAVPLMLKVNKTKCEFWLCSVNLSFEDRKLNQNIDMTISFQSIMIPGNDWNP